LGLKQEVAGDWRKLHNEELHDLYFSCYSGGQIKEHEVGRVCNLFDEEERCIQGFSGET
jgi:hypothetical protein